MATGSGQACGTEGALLSMVLVGTGAPSGFWGQRECAGVGRVRCDITRLPWVESLPSGRAYPVSKVLWWRGWGPVEEWV